MELKYFVIRRTLLLFPTFTGVTIMAFVFLHLFPDSILLSQYINKNSITGGASYYALLSQVKAEQGFNYPLPVQYLYFLINLFQGNWGFATKPIRGPVLSIISVLWPDTAQLLIFTLLFSVLIGIPMGTKLGSRKDSATDDAGRIFSLIGFAMPQFFFGLILMIVFGKGILHWPGSIFPLYGYVSIPIPPPTWLYNFNLGFISSSPTHMVIFDALLHGSFKIAWSAFMHLILPAVAMTYAILAMVVKTMRAGMIDASKEEYVKTAISKGVSERTIVKLHMRRNALLPTITVIGFLMSYLITGLIVIETIFQYQGLGWLVVESALNLQIYGIVYTSLLFGFVIVITTIATDVVYAYIDPRVRY